MEALSDPKCNIFISANAGSGKTTALVERFIALLISGCDISRILCITYTEKAAKEMLERIARKLSEIHTNIDNKNSIEYSKYAGRFNIEYVKNIAEKALLNISDSKISTLHSFLAKLIRQNADLMDVKEDFQILSQEREDKEVYRNYIKKKLIKTTENKDSIDILIKEFSKNTFDSILQEGIEKVEIFSQIIDNKNEFLSIYSSLLNKDVKSKDECVYELFNDDELISDIKDACRFLDEKNVAIISIFLEHKTWGNFLKMVNIFLTSTFKSIRIKLSPELKIIGKKISEKLLDIFTSHSHFLTIHFLNIQQEIDKIYKEFKESQNLLDYTDIIEKVRQKVIRDDEHPILLQIYQNIDHIMLDEAQDTSKNQWDLLHKIFTMFIKNTHEKTKTVLIVGDEKQSIYGFNGSSVKDFSDCEEKYGTFCKNNGALFQKIFLESSYRSGKDIVNFVNRFIGIDKIKEISNISNSRHICTKDFNGKVEISFFKRENKDGSEEKPDFPNTICEKILQLKDSGVGFSKILILTKNRNAIYKEIINKFRYFAIPFESDKESNNLIKRCFWDILSIIKLSSGTIEDYDLAGLLKSCVFEACDEDLQNMRKNKQTTLLQSAIAIDKFNKIYQEILSVFTENFQESVLNILSNEHISSSLKNEYGNDIVIKICNLLIKKSEGLLKSEALSKFDKIEELGITQENLDAVKIMTIHGSKGLDERFVFVIEDKFDFQKTYKPPAEHAKKILFTKPDYSFFSLKSTYFKIGEGIEDINPSFAKIIKNHNEKFDLEEYFRLFYVATTRAKEGLFLFLNDSEEIRDTFTAHFPDLIHEK